MKKIMFYINAIHHGGAERVICNLATSFSKNGYECFLVTSFRDTWEYGYGECVHRISLFEEKISTNFWDRNIQLVKKLRELIKVEQPDLLVSFMAEPNFRAIIASVGLKNKVMISIRNDPKQEYSSILTKVLAKTLFCRADGIVFQTEDAKKWFPRSVQKKSKIILNQVDEVFYNTKYEGKRKNIVTTGRLVPQKNQELLIRAFASIADKITENLFIYGEGILQKDLEHLIEELHMEERIFLPGSITDVAETIKSARLFVLSSDFEGMPNSLMEAMALGIPCVSTDCPCGGPRMLFAQHEAGRLVPCKDVSKLADTIYERVTDGSDGKIEKELAEVFRTQKIWECWYNYVSSMIN